jgi:hypothetical protein
MTSLVYVSFGAGSDWFELMTNFSAFAANGVSARASIKDDLNARLIIGGMVEIAFQRIDAFARCSTC